MIKEFFERQIFISADWSVVGRAW